MIAFSKDAWPTTPMKDPEIRKNRALIIDVMERHGFKVNASEWWHFDFGNQLWAVQENATAIYGKASLS